MDAIITILLGAILLGCVWLLVRYIKKLQDTTDRRFPETRDDGLGGIGSGSTTEVSI
jgi:hypothetical protein